MIFLSPEQRLSAEDERTYYQTHENSPDDPGYRRFLSRLSNPILERLTPPVKGLDFGCGPGPTLCVMLAERGFEMDHYDPLFFPKDELLDNEYDLITCSEVLEHVHYPLDTLALLSQRLKPGGMLAIMTGFPPSATQFPSWHYQRDPTHVCFYGPSCFEWIAKYFGLDLEIPDRNIALLKKRQN